jgi:hypothetical protein
LSNKKKKHLLLQSKLEEVERANASAGRRLLALQTLNSALEKKLGLAVIAHLALHD